MAGVVYAVAAVTGMRALTGVVAVIDVVTTVVAVPVSLISFMCLSSRGLAVVLFH